MSAGPLRQVLDELSAGVPTLAEVSRRTGLDPDVVHAAVDHLVRLGRVSASTLATGCADGGCGSCGAATGCASRGTPNDPGRPVLVTLQVRRP